MIQLKLDENLGSRGKEILADAGFEVSTVYEQQLCSAEDDEPDWYVGEDVVEYPIKLSPHD